MISELRFSLEPEHAPEVSENLENLYLFCEAQIQDALKQRDPAPIAPVRKVLSNLLEAWSQVEIGHGTTTPQGLGKGG